MGGSQCSAPAQCSGAETALAQEEWGRCHTPAPAQLWVGVGEGVRHQGPVEWSCYGPLECDRVTLLVGWSVDLGGKK